MIHRYLPFRLTLRAPALLTGLDGDPNSAFTLDHIPGSTLRGAIAGRLDAEDSATFRPLVLDGAVRYLHAWPVGSERRALPVPLSWGSKKGAHDPYATLDDTAYYSGVPGDDHEVEEVWPTDPLVGFEGRCFSMGAAQPAVVEVTRSARVHHQRDREKGRAWTRIVDGKEEAVGTLFTYESLDAGQTFEGIVHGRAETEAGLDALFAKVKDALPQPLLLGRSRRAGYGGNAEVSWKEVRAREVDSNKLLDASLPRGSRFCVLLTSPCVVRDEDSGQLDPAALPAQLEARLGGRAKVLRRRWGFTTVGGFNRHWGLELPQALALSAGSVLVLEATDDLPRELILDAEHEGFGERRIDGFGRLCFLPEPTARPTLRAVATKRDAAPRPDEPAPPLVTWLQERMLRQALDARIAREAALLADTVRHPPTRSLLGRLRVPLRGQPMQALETLRRWLGDGSDALRRAARTKIDRCRLQVGGKSMALSAWIDSVLNEEGGESVIQPDTLVLRCHLVSEESARVWVTAQRNVWRVRLLDATLAAIALRAKGGRG